MKNFENLCKVSYRFDTESVVVSWFNPFISLDKFREVIGYAVELVKQHNCENWIIDGYNASSLFPDEVINEMKHGLEPMAKGLGIKNVYLIKPKTKGIASTSFRRLAEVVISKDFNVKQIDNMDQVPKPVKS